MLPMDLSTCSNHEIGGYVRSLEANQVGFVPHGMMAFSAQGLKSIVDQLQKL